MSTLKNLLVCISISYFLGCNSDVLSDTKEYNQETNYTNVYVGNPEDLIDGPCCQNLDFGLDPDPDFIINTAQESSDFTFRGWADCTGQCEEDIKACVMHHWNTYKENSERKVCRTYSCGAFGIAYIFSDYGGSNYGRYYKVGYPGAISHYNPSTRQTYQSAWASKRVCLSGEYDYFGETKCFDYYDKRNSSYIKVNKTNYQYPHSHLFKDVFYCTNEITYVLNTSLDSYSGLNNYNPDLDEDPERGMDECLDSQDNDQDGLIDCQDPSCHNVLHNECNEMM
jgi:hypothetical protein